ncbi:MAG: helix-turn-helix transcriptional regulator [Cyanobacteria bacterium P01_E01_bin.42]
MLQSDRVRSSAEGKHKLKQAYKDAKLTQETLAEQAGVSIDTLKRLLGTKAAPNGVERFAVENIAKVLGLKQTDIVDPQEWNPQQQLPLEFEPLIREKTKAFRGRQFVFDELERFMQKYPCGYFTAIADAGMGKTAFAAQYVTKTLSPCYFNVLAERRNRPELFLKSIRQQLILRYELAEDRNKDVDLPTLLTRVAQKLDSTERLVIVVDALDEVEQESGENLLYLPTTLPDRVYFLLTRRPYSLAKKRLFVSPGVPMMELNLQAEKYTEFNRQDIENYIRFCLQEDEEYREILNQWIKEKNITPSEFVKQVAQKSESNFMYLRYVLPGIARGFYNDLNLTQLPDGLQVYYQNHWTRMKMDDIQQEIKVIVLFILLEIGTPIPCDMVAEISGEDEAEVQRILDEWVEYLRPQTVEKEECYSIYHASFLDFLKKKREFKSNRKIFTHVNQRIIQYLEKEMNVNEDF